MNQLLDLVGIFVFALSGALVGVRKRLDVVGMAVLAEMSRWWCSSCSSSSSA